MTPSRRFAVFVNGAAGSVDEVDAEVAEITRAFADHGVHAVVTAVEPEDLPDSMRRSWDGAIDAIVVAGGDGSVNCASGVAAGTDMVIGVLPLGTFNHFAKDLGMPVGDIAECAAWLASATVTPVDVGQVNGRTFVNNASIGVYPQMVVDRDAIREQRGWGKVRAVPVAVVRTLRHLPVHRLRLTIDDHRPIDVETSFLFVGNGLFDDRGKRLGQRTSLTDHRLGVYVIATTRRWRLIVDAVLAKLRGVSGAQNTHRRPAEVLVVESDVAELPIALDGEPIELASPLTFRSCPGGLLVLATPDARQPETR